MLGAAMTEELKRALETIGRPGFGETGSNDVLDPEQEITRELVGELAGKLCLREEIPPRLMFRALRWACDEIDRQRDEIRAVLNVAARIKINSHKM
jgi:hypothetical protein